jgi:hypothetical protein
MSERVSGREAVDLAGCPRTLVLVAAGWLNTKDEGLKNVGQIKKTEGW